MKIDFLHRSWPILTLLDSCTGFFTLFFFFFLRVRCWLHRLSLPVVTMCCIQLVAHPRFHPAGKKPQPRCWLHRPFSPVVVMRCRWLAANLYLLPGGHRSLDAGCITSLHQLRQCVSSSSPHTPISSSSPSRVLPPATLVQSVEHNGTIFS